MIYLVASKSIDLHHLKVQIILHHLKVKLKIKILVITIIFLKFFREYIVLTVIH